MGFKEAVLNVLVLNYANFKGRARRSEYWYYALFMGIINAVFSLLTTIIGPGGFSTFLTVIQTIISLATLVPGIAVCVRRLHDTGKPWPYIFMALIPIAGAIIMIIQLVKDSDPGANEFGPNPKGVN